MSALSLNEIVDVNITLSSAAVPQPAFSVALIIGSSAAIENVIKYYSTPSAMLTDGFIISDTEYVRALELMEQEIQPTEFAVACNAPTSVTQVNTVTISAVTTGDTYAVDINGTTFSHTAAGGDTTNMVLSALQALIAAGQAALNVNAVYTATGAGSLAISAYNSTIQTTSTTQGAAWPGLGFQLTLSGTGVSTMTNTPTTANVSMAAYITTIQNQDTGWYCVNLCSENWYDIMNMAAYIETQTLIYIPTSNDAAIALSTCSYDVLSQLMAKGYNRTAMLVSSQASEGADSGWTGTSIALTPGASTWGDTSIVGITPDNWTNSQFNTIAPKPGTTGGKNGNVYVTVGGNNVVLWGQAVSGRFLDITVGIDWLQSEIQGNIWDSIVAARQAGGKIPYTNKGASVFVGDVKEAIDDGVANGLVDGTQPISITVPDVSTQTTTNKTNRVAPPVSFTCVLAGAYSTATVNGVLSV